MKPTAFGVVAALAAMGLLSCASEELSPRQRAEQFLNMYNGTAQPLYTANAQAQWKASTDVSEQHTGERIGADRAWGAFAGSAYVIEQSKTLLEKRTELEDLATRQLREIMLTASEYPGTIPEVVQARVEQEAKQSAILDSFEFCAERRGERCVQTLTPNEIDNILRDSRKEAERRRVWEVSKQIGPALRPGLLELRRLRNQLAQEMGYSSFFALQVADYGMSVTEMMLMMEGFLADLRPLYEQVHGWAKHRLAERYRQPPPKRIPAHWIGNRWAQAWPGLTAAVDLDGLFQQKSPEWIVEQAERFYTSLGMPALPQSFWERSDLYQLPPDAKRKKKHPRLGLAHRSRPGRALADERGAELPLV